MARVSLDLTWNTKMRCCHGIHVDAHTFRDTLPSLGWQDSTTRLLQGGAASAHVAGTTADGTHADGSHVQERVRRLQPVGVGLGRHVRSEARLEGVKMLRRQGRIDPDADLRNARNEH